MASVLVTGASRGIGFATTLALGRAGHTVYATMRDPRRSQDLEEIVETEHLAIRISAMDIDSDASVKKSIGSILKTHGPLDVLVNNAGIERTGSVEELDIAEVRAVMETNYFGALRCIQAVMPGMRARRSGCIINVTSVSGRVSSPPLGAYSASKFALEALSESLAQEAKMFNIRVAIVQPGIIDTAMARRIGSEPAPSVYPHSRRMAALFALSLEQPTQPSVVAEKILEIIENGEWRLRYPVGPEAEGYLQRRASMTDEQWIERGAADDETWSRSILRAFGRKLT